MTSEPPSVSAAPTGPLQCAFAPSVTLLTTLEVPLGSGQFKLYLHGPSGLTAPAQGTCSGTTTFKATVVGRGMMGKDPFGNACGMGTPGGLTPLAVTLTLQPPSGESVTTLVEYFQLVDSLYPPNYPFAVTNGASVTTSRELGSGELTSHIFGICPPGGKDNANVQWQQT